MRIERHIRTCRWCRRELYELEATWSMLEEWQVDRAEAPFRPDVLRAGLESRFGKPRRSASWREVLSYVQSWGVLKPLPVAVMVGSLTALLAWWDTFTGPSLLESTRPIAQIQATPTPEVFGSPMTKRAEDIRSLALRDIDRSTRSLRRIQTVAGVRVAGRAEDILSELNRPSTPLPSTPPQATVIFASAGRL
jgi:hypothetical protein